MKTTKVVDIIVCDICHEECYGPQKCVTCKKEVCTECMDSIHVSVRRNHSAKINGEGKNRYKSYGTSVVQTEFNSRYCIDCGANIIEELLAAGFVSSKPEKSVVVMD